MQASNVISQVDPALARWFLSLPTAQADAFMAEVVVSNNLNPVIPICHPIQSEFVQSPVKRKVIVAGRRGGKTTGVSILAANRLLQNRRVLYAAPTYDQTEAFWQASKRYFANDIKAGKLYKNETQRIIELSTGGRIRAKTAWDADSLRGDYADTLIMEEYSLMNPTAWDEVGSPMLLDNNGDAVFIFTPKRKNHAYKLYQRAISDTSGRWQAWHFTSHDNPYLSKEALAEITQDMTDASYRQEILAEFLESEGQVFRNLAACMFAPPTTPAEHQGHRIVAGLDWAKQNDFTFTSLVCADCKQEVAQDRFNQIDYHFQRDRLGVLWNTWNVVHIEAEANSIGEPNIEELQRSGFPVVGFQTTATSKPPLIESLALCFERVECQWLNNPVCTGELESYELKMSPNTNRPVYSAPSGMNDDTVMGRALSWRAVTNSVGIEVITVDSW